MKNFMSRRIFLTVAISSVALLVWKKNTERIHNEKLKPDDRDVYSLFLVNSKNLPKTNNRRVVSLLPKTPTNLAWLKQYDATRLIFIKQKKLLEIQKFENNEKIIIVNKWSSRKDFDDFCKSTKMDKLVQSLANEVEFQLKVDFDFRNVITKDFKLFHHEIYT